MDVELGGFLSQNSTYDYDDDYEYKDDKESGRSEAVLIPLLLSVVIFVGLLGHCLLLAVLVLKRKHWSPSDTFILHVGVADILLLLTLPFWAVQAADPSGWYFGSSVCKISGVIFNMNVYCGVLTLLCICFDQRRTVFPNSADKCGFFKKPVPTHHTCGIVWICCLLLTIPDWMYLAVETRTGGGAGALCVHDFSQTGIGLQIFARLSPILLGFLVPAVILVIFCCMLQFKSEGVQKQRVAVVILSLVVALLLCWIPYVITVITDTLRKKHKTSSGSLSGDAAAGESSLRLALMYTAAVACVHACLRPLLYLGMSTNFRKWTLALLRCESHDFKGSFWELCGNKGAEPAVQSQEVVRLTPESGNVVIVQCGATLPQC